MTNRKSLENTGRWRKTKRGLVTNLFHKMKSRHEVNFDLNYLHEFSICIKFNRLFTEWVKSNYDKRLKPSIDRINSKKGYSKNNIQWLTWEENRYKQRMECKLTRARLVGQFTGENMINSFRSVSEAVIKTGIPQGNLSSCLSGKRKTCHGYIWKYIDTRKRSHAIKMTSRVCGACPKEFIPQHKGIKYCSRRCGAVGNNNAKK